MRQVGRQLPRGTPELSAVETSNAAGDAIIFASSRWVPATHGSQNLTPIALVYPLAGYLNPNSSTLGSMPLVFCGLDNRLLHSFTPRLTVQTLSDIATNFEAAPVLWRSGGPARAPPRPPNLDGVQNRLHPARRFLPGAVAIIPSAVEGATQVRTFQGPGATSLLILVGRRHRHGQAGAKTYCEALQRYEGWCVKTNRILFLGPPGGRQGHPGREAWQPIASLLHLSTGRVAAGRSQGPAGSLAQSRGGDGPGASWFQRCPGGWRSFATDWRATPEGGCCMAFPANVAQAESPHLVASKELQTNRSNRFCCSAAR